MQMRVAKGGVLQRLDKVEKVTARLARQLAEDPFILHQGLRGIQFCV